MFKAVITGITRVAKENLFSGINNLVVYTVFDNSYSKYFGFTEEEVFSTIESLKVQINMNIIKEWYNGYNYGGETIYNPWSVTEYFSKGIPDTYWANTSDNELIKRYISKMDESGKIDLEQLIKNQAIEIEVDTKMVYSDLDKDAPNDRIWTLFLLCGYLKISSIESDDLGIEKFKLSIPNKEISIIFNKIIRSWFEGSKISREFINSLEYASINRMEVFLNKISRETFSYFDTGKNQAESFYHAFFLGLLINIRDKYIIESNKESGYGRYDICLKPIDISKYGYIIEFKAFDADFHMNIDDAVEEALNQINEKKYDSNLIQYGVKNIIKLAIVFKGKLVKIAKG